MQDAARQVWWVLGAALATAAAIAPAAAQPAAAGTAQGIGCAKARSVTEKAICASPALIALDRQAAAAYAEALAQQPERRDALRQEQLAWLRQRDAACALPSRTVEACLGGQLTARVAALAPPAPAAPRIDAPAAPRPDPALPGVTAPPAAAALDQANLPAAEQAETLLRVTAAGRFTLAAKGPGGAALQLVDMLTGPSELAGAAGSQDGRLDLMLDVGVYKLRVLSAKGAAGMVALRVAAFQDAAPPAALPRPGQTLTATLRDGEQRAFWLSVPPSGAVRIEAAGRALADLRLWRDGRELSALEPVVTPIEPVPGRPLTDIRLSGTVEPGTYLAVAYGGPAATWTDGDAAQPFHLRSGASDALQAGWAGGPVGPFGSEVFDLPASIALLRLHLPQAAAAEVAAGSAAARIARDSREPVASLAVTPGQQPVVEVRAAAGQPFTLRALDRPPGLTLDRPGTYWVSAVANGAGGDEVPPTVLLERSDRSDAPPRIVADTLPQIGPNAAWHARFNLRGATTLLARSAGGPVALRTTGAAVRGGRVTADLPDGFYALSLTPREGAGGALDLVLGPPGAAPPLVPPLPPDPVLPLGIQAVAPGERLRLRGGEAPGLSLGLSARPVPVALVEGPLFLTLAAGAGTDVPVQVAPGGTLSVTEVGGGAAPYALWKETGRSTVTLPPADHARTVVLAWRRAPAAVAAIPAPPPPDAEAAVQAGTPTYFDLARDEGRSFGLTVAEGGLYRIETLGRLRTSGRLATPFIPRLGEAAGGVGQNMLIQTTLRAGRYRVQVSAQDSAGHAGLLATPAPLLPTAELRPGGSVRATLPAGSGAAIPVILDAEQAVHLDVMGLGAPWHGRLEDADGWPLTTPGALDGIERTMPPGRYRMVVEPAPVTRQVVARLRTVEQPAPVAGHGPHKLPFGQAQTAIWREPDSQAAPRTPDRWTFTLDGAAEVTLTLGDAMAGELRLAGSDRPGRRVVRQFNGRLEPGSYELDVTSLGRNDRADYAVALDSAALQHSVPRQVAVPATLPFAIAAARVVSLTSFGGTPVKAVLRDAAGRVVLRAGARADDWNIAVTRPLPAGSYTLDLLAAAAPGMADTALRDAAAPDDSSGNDDDVPDSDEQAAQTPASQAPDTAQATAPRPDSDDAPAPTVEVRLSLPPTLAPAPAPSEASLLPGQGVHVLTLEPPPPGSLVVAQAQSASAVALTLERQDAQGWQVVALDEGRTPVVASPADGDARPWRVQAWAVDGGPDTIRLAARAVTAAAQAPGRVALAALDGMAAPLAVAQVQMAPGLATLGGAPDGLLVGSWPGRGLSLATGGALPQGGGLWLLGPAGALDVSPLAVPPGQAVALTVPAGVEATLPAGDAMQLWLAQGGAGLPSLGAAMGWAPGSAIALGAAPLRDGAGGALRVDLRRFDLTPAAARAVDTALHAVLPPGGALPVTLPPGDKQVQLDLSAGTGAIPAWHAPGSAAWAGDAAVSRTLSGDWTELLLVNPGAVPAPVALAVSPSPPAVVLAPGQVHKRFFGAAGSFEMAVRGAPDARLHLAGPGALTVIGADGQVGAGRDLPMAQPGRVVVSHGIGALALWMDAPDASPWPAPAAQPMAAPGRVALSGPAMAFTLVPTTPVLLHVSTTAPVLLGLAQGARTEPPALFPAGAELHRMVAAGQAELRLYPPQDGGLTGTLDVRAEPILPVSEGLGAAVAVPPGGAAAFGFTLSRAATVGVGVRAEPDRASARLLDSAGRVVGEGVAQLAALPPGRYVLEPQVPPDAPATLLRPAVVGITPRPNGPPPDVVQRYLELAGMKPQGPAP